MRSFRLISLVSAILSIATFTAHAQLKTYSDPKTGVSFQYPSVWVPYAKAPSSIGPNYDPSATKARAAFTFVSAHNVYQKTVLLSLIFSYYAVPAKDLQACAKSVVDATGTNVPPITVTINGTQYQEFDGAEGAMQRQQAFQIDIAYRDNQCFVFERDFNTQSEGIDTTRRKLTASEIKALQGHLDAIMTSVTFAKL